MNFELNLVDGFELDSRALDLRRLRHFWYFELNTVSNLKFGWRDFEELCSESIG